MKRLRAPRAKPGELKAQWGKLPGDSPDIVFAWGPGCRKVEANNLQHALCGPVCRTNWDAPLGSPRVAWTVYDPSFVKVLESCGYDITTLKFSIRKKQT